MHTEYSYSNICVNYYPPSLCNAFSSNLGPMTLGERLRLARQYAKISQAELEKRSGVDQATISKIERDDQKGSTEIVQLAVACGVRPEWLAMESGEMVDGLYVHDEKLKRMLMIAQELPEYAKDRAIKELADLVEFVEHAENAQAAKK